MDLTTEQSKAGTVEDLRRGVAHFLHGEVDTAHRLVAAIGAGHVRRLAGAGDRGERAVEHPNDLAQVDIRRITGEEVASSLPLAASQDALVPEAEQNQLELIVFGPRHEGDGELLHGWWSD